MKKLSILVLYICIFLLIKTYECKSIKDKHANKNNKSNKNKKRWMNNFAQNFMGNEPEQFGQQFSPENAFAQPAESVSQQPQESAAFGYGGAGVSVPPTSFQGMEELKIPKQSYAGSEEAQSYAQDVASYLKPGIGDYPSDMPGGIKGFEAVSGINGIGVPIASKPKQNRLTPVSALVQSAMEDAALNPQSMHRPSASNGGGDTASILSDALNNDEVSPAKVTMVITGKTESATTNFDKEPAKEDPDKELVKITKEVSKEKESKADTAKESAKGSKDEESKELSKSEKGKSDSLSDDKAKGSDKEIKEAAFDEKEKDKENKKEKEKVKEGDEKAKEVESKVEKTGEDGKKVTEGDEKTADASDKKVDKEGKEEKEKVMYKSSKHKTETGERRENFDGFIDSGNNHIEAVGLPTLKAPLEFADADEKDVSITIKDGSEIDGDETPSKVKAKLVSSLRNALLQNVKELMDESRADDIEESSTKGSVSADKQAVDKEDATKTSEGEPSKETSAEDNQPDLLEDNLMKIDKKKLVHLLATMMRKNREKQDEDEKESTGNGKEKAKENSNQNSSENNGQDFVQVSSPTKSEASQYQLENQQTHAKHRPKFSQYGISMDPYAQIGLIDPTNDDAGTLHSDRHSVHQGHEKKKQDAGDDAEKSNEDGKQKEGEKVEVLTSKEDKGAKDDSKKESYKEKEKEKAEAKAQEKEKEKSKAEENDQKVNEGKELSKGEKVKEKEKQSEKEKEKLSAKQEAKNVEEQVEKERQELKKIREEEKEEKVKQSELKASNAELENKEKEKVDAEKVDKAEDDIPQKVVENKEDKTEDDKPMKVQHGNFLHLVSPDLVNAIAENLKNGKGLLTTEESQEGESVKEQKEESKEASKEENKVENNEESKLDGKGESKETDKESKDNDNDSKNEEVPNLQKLIQNMKEKLLGKQKQNKTKGSRRHKGISDDAYAQIGSADPNLKRRGREKKHRVRHPHKH